MRIRMLALALIAAPLAACATTSAGLYRTAPQRHYESDKTPQQVATCMVEMLRWDPVLRNDGDHYWVLRNNGYGVPVVRWDFTPRPGGGSIAELRASFGISTGEGRIRDCL